ncbi:MAG: electron transport protein SCO1/SenC [Bryobacterales bacterium]|nr:electron transport protein SCO1/SenC [Bryobacterales bacterium]
MLVLALTGCAARADLPSYGAVSDFTLTDQTGANFAAEPTLKGHVWVANFMFTNCPGPCPRMSSQMHEVQSALAGQDVKLVSITVDPDRDTPEKLAKYAQFYSATPGVWYFLTGPRETLNHLGEDVFKLGPVDGTLDHSTRFVLVDRKSHIRGYYLTSEPDAIKRVIDDAKALLRQPA